MAATNGGRLAERVAVVTGGGAGIGHAIAKRFADEGAIVVVADMAGAEQAAAALVDAGHAAVGIETDVADDAAVEGLAGQIRDEFGRCDILVNNAAIATSISPRPFSEIPLDEWRRIYEVNVFGIVRCCRALVPLMSAETAGRIVNIASAAALKGVPFLSHYVSSKGAVLALTKSLARELGERNILVNAIAPGFTLSESMLDNSGQMETTRQGSLQGRSVARDMYPDDVVGAVMFLVSSDGSFVTGQTVVVDGGTYLH